MCYGGASNCNWALRGEKLAEPSSIDLREWPRPFDDREPAMCSAEATRWSNTGEFS